MPQPVLRIVLTDEERATLNAWSRSTAGEHRMVERSRVILLAAEGLSAREIARRLKTRLARVSKWRRRFGQNRLAGLEDAARPGKPKTYDEKTEKRVLTLLDADPPEGYSLSMANHKLSEKCMIRISGFATQNVKPEHI